MLSVFMYSQWVKCSQPTTRIQILIMKLKTFFRCNGCQYVGKVPVETLPTRSTMKHVFMSPCSVCISCMCKMI